MHKLQAAYVRIVEWRVYNVYIVYNVYCTKYLIIRFLNGHLHVDYIQIHVTKLAEWSCGQVRKKIVNRGDDKKWVGSYDGFYLTRTRGHYSNNASATLHATRAHWTKKGPGHNRAVALQAGNYVIITSVWQNTVCARACHAWNQMQIFTKLNS